MTRFAIGQQFTPRGRYPRVCTVVDIHKTYNHAGELVKVRYVVEHDFCGQKIIDADVCETTIAMASWLSARDG